MRNRRANFFAVYSVVTGFRAFGHLTLPMAEFNTAGYLNLFPKDATSILNKVMIQRTQMG